MDRKRKRKSRNAKRPGLVKCFWCISRRTNQLMPVEDAVTEFQGSPICEYHAIEMEKQNQEILKLANVIRSRTTQFEVDKVFDKYQTRTGYKQ